MDINTKKMIESFLEDLKSGEEDRGLLDSTNEKILGNLQEGTLVLKDIIKEAQQKGFSFTEKDFQDYLKEKHQVFSEEDLSKASGGVGDHFGGGKVGKYLAAGAGGLSLGVGAVNVVGNMMQNKATKNNTAIVQSKDTSTPKNTKVKNANLKGNTSKVSDLDKLDDIDSPLGGGSSGISRNRYSSGKSNSGGSTSARLKNRLSPSGYSSSRARSPYGRSSYGGSSYDGGSYGRSPYGGRIGGQRTAGAGAKKGASSEDMQKVAQTLDSVAKMFSSELAKRGINLTEEQLGEFLSDTVLRSNKARDYATALRSGNVAAATQIALEVFEQIIQSMQSNAKQIANQEAVKKDSNKDVSGQKEELKLKPEDSEEKGKLVLNQSENKNDEEEEKKKEEEKRLKKEEEEERLKKEEKEKEKREEEERLKKEEKEKEKRGEEEKLKKEEEKKKKKEEKEKREEEVIVELDKKLVKLFDEKGDYKSDSPAGKFGENLVIKGGKLETALDELKHKNFVVKKDVVKQLLSAADEKSIDWNSVGDEVVIAGFNIDPSNKKNNQKGVRLKFYVPQKEGGKKVLTSKPLKENITGQEICELVNATFYKGKNQVLKFEDDKFVVNSSETNTEKEKVKEKAKNKENERKNDDDKKNEIEGTNKAKDVNKKNDIVKNVNNKNNNEIKGTKEQPFINLATIDEDPNEVGTYNEKEDNKETKGINEKKENKNTDINGKEDATEKIKGKETENEETLLVKSKLSTDKSVKKYVDDDEKEAAIDFVLKNAKEEDLKGEGYIDKLAKLVEEKIVDNFYKKIKDKIENAIKNEKSINLTKLPLDVEKIAKDYIKEYPGYSHNSDKWPDWIKDEVKKEYNAIDKLSSDIQEELKTKYTKEYIDKLSNNKDETKADLTLATKMIKEFIGKKELNKDQYKDKITQSIKETRVNDLFNKAKEELSKKGINDYSDDNIRKDLSSIISSKKTISESGNEVVSEFVNSIVAFRQNNAINVANKIKGEKNGIQLTVSAITKKVNTDNGNASEEKDKNNQDTILNIDDYEKDLNTKTANEATDSNKEKNAENNENGEVISNETGTENKNQIKVNKEIFVMKDIGQTIEEFELYIKNLKVAGEKNPFGAILITFERKDVEKEEETNSRESRIEALSEVAKKSGFKIQRMKNNEGLLIVLDKNLENFYSQVEDMSFKSPGRVYGEYEYKNINEVKKALTGKSAGIKGIKLNASEQCKVLEVIDSKTKEKKGTFAYFRSNTINKDLFDEVAKQESKPDVLVFDGEDNDPMLQQYVESNILFDGKYKMLTIGKGNKILNNLRGKTVFVKDGSSLEVKDKYDACLLTVRDENGDTDIANNLGEKKIKGINDKKQKLDREKAKVSEATKTYDSIFDNGGKPLISEQEDVNKEENKNKGFYILNAKLESKQESDSTKQEDQKKDGTNKQETSTQIALVANLNTNMLKEKNDVGIVVVLDKGDNNTKLQIENLPGGASDWELVTDQSRLKYLNMADNLKGCSVFVKKEFALSKDKIAAINVQSDNDAEFNLNEMVKDILEQRDYDRKVYKLMGMEGLKNDLNDKKINETAYDLLKQEATYVDVAYHQMDRGLILNKKIKLDNGEEVTIGFAKLTGEKEQEIDFKEDDKDEEKIPDIAILSGKDNDLTAKNKLHKFNENEDEWIMVTDETASAFNYFSRKLTGGWLNNSTVFVKKSVLKDLKDYNKVTLNVDENKKTAHGKALIAALEVGKTEEKSDGKGNVSAPAININDLVTKLNDLYNYRNNNAKKMEKIEKQEPKIQQYNNEKNDGLEEE